MRDEHTSFVVDPEEEANRLWLGATTALASAGGRLIPLSEALDLGIRAAQILATLRLQGVAERFPATIASLLVSPPADIDPWRDAVAVPKSLQFVDVVDMLSEDGLECASPGLHHGWEDRRFSCMRSRKLAQKATGVTLDEGTRDRLLLLIAYRNRIFVTPPPVRVDPDEIVACFPALEDLVERLTAEAG